MLRRCTAMEAQLGASPRMDHLQMAVKLEHSALVPKVVNNWNTIFLGLRTKIVDNHFARVDKEAAVIKLPEWIDDAETACHWMFEKHTPSYKDSLATLGFNHHIVAINTSHAVSDGGLMVRAYQHCLDDNIGKSPEITRSMNDVYKNQIETLVRNRKVPFPTFTSFENNFEQSKGQFKPGHYSYYRMPVQTFKCFDKTAKRPLHFTEHQWFAMSLATAAYNGERVDELSFPITIDLRQFHKGPIDWSFGNHFASPGIKASVSQNETISSILTKFREDLEAAKKDGRVFRHIVAEYTSYPKPTRSNGIISTVGPIFIKKPILDFHFLSTNRGIGSQMMTTLAYSKVFEDGRNEYFIQFMNQPAFIPDKIKDVLIKSYFHTLTEIPDSVTFKEAFDEVKRFQQSYLQSIQ